MSKWHLKGNLILDFITNVSCILWVKRWYNWQLDGNLSVFSGLSHEYIKTECLTHPSKRAKWKQNRLFYFRVKCFILRPLTWAKRTNLRQNPTHTKVLHQRSLFCERPTKVLDGLNSFWHQMRLKLITLFDTCQKTTTVHAMVHSHLRFITRLQLLSSSRMCCAPTFAIAIPIHSIVKIAFAMG